MSRREMTEREMTEREMTERELSILSRAAEVHPDPWLTLAEIAEWILPGCPGPRCADAYARECTWELSKLGLLSQHERREKYQITPMGRWLIESVNSEAVT